MVLNLTRPVTATRLPEIKTRREQAYDNGKSDGLSNLKNLSKGELRIEMKKVRRDLRDKKGKIWTLEEEMKRLDVFISTNSELRIWADDFLVFEKPKDGASASLRRAFSKQQVSSIHETIAETAVPDFGEIFDEGMVFRIEHDWFKAIHKATEFENGSFKLPYDVSIFEFEISRHPLVAICTNYDSSGTSNEIIMQIAIQAMAGWYLSDNIYRHDGMRWEVLKGGQSIDNDAFKRLVYLVGNQIRAACIALDAEVATSVLVRASHAGHQTETHEHPEYEYYIINLANRQRTDMMQSHGETKGTKRLHFRRGHWRHYATFKTWVRWALVGNPELGFIDKQYRL
jgi:hypothetical protein